jgi:excisionase family DNA binding protein
MIEMKERYFTPEQVAETLQVSIDTILRLINNKKIKASKIGNQWRIKEGALEKYLEEQSNIPENKN